MIDLENYAAAVMTCLYGELDYTRYYNADSMHVEVMEILQKDDVSTISKAQYDAYRNLASQDPEVPRLTMNAMWR